MKSTASGSQHTTLCISIVYKPIYFLSLFGILIVIFYFFKLSCGLTISYLFTPPVASPGEIDYIVTENRKAESIRKQGPKYEWV